MIDYIHPIKIGNVQLENNVFLAPLAGVTDSAYRLMCKEYGAGLVYSEMISSKGACYDSAKTLELADIKPGEHPCAIQIFGSEPDIMARSAVMFEKMGAAMIDINMGCPMRKITSNREGSYLMLDTDLVGRIVYSVANAVKIPVTVKMRRGYNMGEELAVDVALACEQNGAQAVTVHGRFREQYYEGVSDRGIIAKVRRAVKIPVIGNGDVDSYESACSMMEETGCDAVMIGRSSMGDPHIFHRIINGDNTQLSLTEKAQDIHRHLAYCVEFKGEQVAVREMRKNLLWYIKGIRGAASLRNQLSRVSSIREIEEAVDSIFTN